MHRRKLGLGVGGRGLFAWALVALAGFTVWFFALRDRDDRSDDRTGRSAAAPRAREPSSAAPPGENAGERDAPGGPDLDPAGPLRLDGQVVDEGGAPLGDALVVVDSRPPRTTRSQADGSFHFDQLLGRAYSLRGRSGTRLGSITSKLTRASDPVVLQLRRGLTVAVTVRDAEEAPIHGAIVRISDDLFSTKPPAEETLNFATDEQGRALVTHVAAGPNLLVASAEGHAPASKLEELGAAGLPHGEIAHEISLTLPRGVELGGKIVDERGAPVAGARVTCRASAWPYGRSDVVSDERGAFHFAAVAPGDYTLSAADGVHAPGELARLTVAERAVQGLSITLGPGGRASGVVVTSSGTEAPYATVRISVLPESSSDPLKVFDSVRQIASDAHGRFEVRGLPRARLQLCAEGELASSKVVQLSLAEAPRKDGLRVVLDVEGALSGVVVDEAGEPRSEAVVHADRRSGSGSSWDEAVTGPVPSTPSDGNGAFALRGLPEGSYSLWATSGDRDEAELTKHLAKTGDQDVRLVLATPGRIVGKLLLHGQPPARASIFLHGDRVTGRPVYARAGAFVTGPLEPGVYTLRVRGPDFSQHLVEDLVVSAGRETDAGLLELDAGRRLVGRVVDAAGRPVAGAKVRAGVSVDFAEEEGDDVRSNQHRPIVKRAVTDAQGAFELRGLSDKAQFVAADHASGRSDSIAIARGNEDPPPATLQLAGFGSIGGVVRVRGVPTGDIMIYVSSGAGLSEPSALTRNDGSYLVKNVPAGKRRVATWPMNGTWRSDSAAETTVVQGQRATIDLTLESAP